MNVQPLTWYPGTVLPYASLWHTLARATWLNDLRAGDISSRVEGQRPEESEQPIEYWSDRGERDARAVASALGEPQSALSQFAVIEQFPAMVRAVYMVQGLRWCPACVAGGFHTLLGSIQLVTRCPIHAVPLIDACPQCADGFRMRFGGLAVGAAALPMRPHAFARAPQRAPAQPWRRRCGRLGAGGALGEGGR